MEETLNQLLAQHHGVVGTSELRDAGFTKRQISALVEQKLLIRGQRGRYLAPIPVSAISIARALGGSLTCLSALDQYSMWVPRRPATPHVRVTRGVAAGNRRSLALAPILRSTRLHVPTRPVQLPQPDGLPEYRDVDPLSTALTCAASCCTRNELVAIGDSALRHGVTMSELAEIARFGDRRLRTAFELLDPGSDSGIESIMRMNLRPLQVRLRSQVWLVGWPVDLLVGDWLVVEVDGHTYHSQPRDIDRDRIKDRQLQEAGYTVLRYSYRAVMHEWAQHEPQFLRFIRAGRHKRPTYRGANAVPAFPRA